MGISGETKSDRMLVGVYDQKRRDHVSCLAN